MYSLINKSVLNDGCICQLLRTCMSRVAALPEVPRHRNISTGRAKPEHTLSKSQYQSSLRCARQLSGRPGGAMNVFDRTMKRKQKKWAASLQDGDQYDYLRAEVTLTCNWITDGYLLQCDKYKSQHYIFCSDTYLRTDWT